MRRCVTDHPVGLPDGLPTLDGEGVLWFQDETGDESGRWLVEPFTGGDVTPFVDGLPYGWNQGLAQAPGVVAVAISDRDGFTVHTACDGAPAKELARAQSRCRSGELGWAASIERSFQWMDRCCAWNTENTAT